VIVCVCLFVFVRVCVCVRQREREGEMKGFTSATVSLFIARSAIEVIAKVLKQKKSFDFSLHHARR
jgi:hypothetical protein